MKPLPCGHDPKERYVLRVGGEPVGQRCRRCIREARAAIRPILDDLDARREARKAKADG